MKSAGNHPALRLFRCAHLFLSTFLAASPALLATLLTTATLLTATTLQIKLSIFCISLHFVVSWIKFQQLLATWVRRNDGVVETALGLPRTRYCSTCPTLSRTNKQGGRAS